MATLSVLVLCTMQTGWAQSANDVVVTLKAQKVQRSSDGRETLKVADRAMPGEVIQYDALYKNQSRKGIRNLEPTLPIPPGLEYVPGSASPAPAKASLDGKNFAPVPLKRQVPMPDGQMKEELVPYSQYRALRWEMGDLEPGRTAVISARAVLALN
jgi:uncharacterized repeat protein (TIGR01451 family)